MAGVSQIWNINQSSVFFQGSLFTPVAPPDGQHHGHSADVWRELIHAQPQSHQLHCPHPRFPDGVWYHSGVFPAARTGHLVTLRFAMIWWPTDLETLQNGTPGPVKWNPKAFETNTMPCRMDPLPMQIRSPYPPEWNPKPCGMEAETGGRESLTPENGIPSPVQKTASSALAEWKSRSCRMEPQTQYKAPLDLLQCHPNHFSVGIHMD